MEDYKKKEMGMFRTGPLLRKPKMGKKKQGKGKLEKQMLQKNMAKFKCNLVILAKKKCHL